MTRLLVALLALCAAAHAQLIKLPSPPEIEPAGYKLILDFEVGGGPAYYNRFLIHPEWPGAASGVTVGVGYDCGYNSRAVILTDWQQLEERDRLAACTGVTGSRARALLPTVRDIDVEWPLAEGVFQRVSITRFWQLCRRTWGPEFDALDPRCQWALLSLTFNRGSSMAGPSRAEMREIRDLVPKRDYAAIAVQLRKMPRVWIGRDIERAMRKRREAEARLVESAL